MVIKSGKVVRWRCVNLSDSDMMVTDADGISTAAAATAAAVKTVLMRQVAKWELWKQ